MNTESVYIIINYIYFMFISIILAHIFGICFIVLGLSMVLNKSWTAIVVEEMANNQSVLWLAGLVTITMGSIIVVLNNSWIFGLPLFMSILGWLTLLKGAIILIFPGSSISYYRKINKGNIFVWGGVFVFILGLIMFLQ